jgi:hypothetical protein
MTIETRPPRVTSSEHAAFISEIKDLRRRTNKLRSARLKFVHPDHDPGKQRLDEWAAEARACRARLDYWHDVLVIGRKIRAPVRLYDCWHRVETIASLNEFEVRYFRYLFLGEPHPADKTATMGSDLMGTYVASTQEVAERLGLTGTHVCLTVIEAERIPQAVEDGTLTEAAEPASIEEQRWRYAFMAWDRIRTEEPDSWSCALCGRDYSGLRMLSILGVIDDPRTPGSAGPVDVPLVCASCASASPDEMEREIASTLGLARRN